VYDKTVRRRRAVLALLVVSSLILLTIYFGEPAGSGLHSIQRGVLQVLSPIQEGASRALKPARDLFGWFGDTLHAKGQVKTLRKQVQELRVEAIAGQNAVRQNVQLTKLLGLDASSKLAPTHPVSARVISVDPSVWSQTIAVDVGSSDGVRPGQPVIDGDGLVGSVSDTVAPNSAVVDLITNSDASISARVSRDGVLGVLQPAIGDQNDLLLKFTRASDDVRPGDAIDTSGTVSRTNRFASLYPPGIPVGIVTRVDDPGSDTQTIHVHPFADVRGLEFVQVLTRQVNGNRP
jgi:rod shape-determining protein MreC